MAEDLRQVAEAAAEERHEPVNRVEEAEARVAVEEQAALPAEVGEEVGWDGGNGEAEGAVGLAQVEQERGGLGVVAIDFGDAGPVDGGSEAGLELGEVDEGSEGWEDAVVVGVGELGVED